MKGIDSDNRFEIFLRKYKGYLSSIDYFIKIIFIVIILLFLLEFFSFVVLEIYNNKVVFDKRMSGDIYKDEEWASEYIIESAESSKAEYYPYVGYRRIPNYNGKYININSDSIRKTFFQCPNNYNNIRIFVFGGSTVWGTGVRDNSTIPSFLSKELCQKGFSVEVVNFGESGYTNTQEIFKLLLELRKENIPDIIIFYDGVNDIYSSYQNGVAGLPQNIENRKKDFNSQYRLNVNALFQNFNNILGKITKLIGKGKTVRRIQDNDIGFETVDFYLNNVKIIRALEDDYKVKSFFYWQPTIYTKKHLSDCESKIPYNNFLSQSYGVTSDLMKKNDQVNDLTSIFDAQEGTIFFDWCHISEEGNSIIATKIAEDIIKYLDEKNDKFDRFNILGQKSSQSTA